MLCIFNIFILINQNNGPQYDISYMYMIYFDHPIQPALLSLKVLSLENHNVKYDTHI